MWTKTVYIKKVFLFFHKKRTQNRVYLFQVPFHYKVYNSPHSKNAVCGFGVLYVCSLHGKVTSYSFVSKLMLGSRSIKGTAK